MQQYWRERDLRLMLGRRLLGERFAEPTPEQAIAARDAPGGTAPARVAEQLSALTWRVGATRAWAKA